MKNIKKTVCAALGILALLTWSCKDKDQTPIAPTPVTTKVIAHRGAWLRTGAPQNSLASLNAAIKLGVYASEFDVQMSADSVLFVSAADSITLGSKDPKGNKMLIEQAPFDSLAKIKLSNSELLPTIETYLGAGKVQATTRLILKIKPSRVSKQRSLQLARKAVSAVQAQGLQTIADYSSLDYDVCKLIRQLVPAAKVSYVGSDKTPEQIQADKISEVDYIADTYVNDIDLVKRAQGLKLTTNVWLVNSQNLMDYLIWKKLDYITTDEPELLLKIIKK
ncbi:glycerophosphodiester phosphodiesterase [Dyadobacter frigoris]|uniref:Glycerophosphodiester phosphodiesterase n=1 Tax=Dyadobacter frigoris TaxID=2576211 RepID=A0A4U6D4I4_9BACT|nr:glycerophosphodiester phosphodiesterase family protein [Dyadobacter frigoris]TKT92210.1 glycerophosphodiester phosphodiesterase [Dyadobacter frigoris]GLU53381.1 glycerophosphoryl diester phosphodiesterase [Dyadobacter frigoris]